MRKPGVLDQGGEKAVHAAEGHEQQRRTRGGMALRVQPVSRMPSPITQLRTALAMRLLIFDLGILAIHAVAADRGRCLFQSRRAGRGMSRGSFCRSPSRRTRRSPLAARMPARRAALGRSFWKKR